VIKIDLAPHGVTHVDRTCDDTLASAAISVKGGPIVIDVQPSLDGLTWQSPLFGVRLKDEDKTVPLTLPQGTRKLRFLLHNSHGKPATVSVAT
jgi:hypothetical protein